MVVIKLLFVWRLGRLTAKAKKQGMAAVVTASADRANSQLQLRGRGTSWVPAPEVTVYIASGWWLSVSGRWFSGVPREGSGASTDGTRFDVENVAFPRHKKLVLVLEWHSTAL